MDTGGLELPMKKYFILLFFLIPIRSHACDCIVYSTTTSPNRIISYTPSMETVLCQSNTNYLVNPTFETGVSTNPQKYWKRIGTNVRVMISTEKAVVDSEYAAAFDLIRIKRIYKSPLTDAGTILLVSSTVYCVYLGVWEASSTPKFVEFNMTTAGAGAQIAEVGIAYSTAPPRKQNVFLTKITSTGAVDTLTATLTTKRNTNPLSISIAQGTYVWACIRTRMATTQPTLRALTNDMGEGYLTTVVAQQGTMDSLASWTGTLLAAPANTPGPDLRLTLD